MTHSLRFPAAIALSLATLAGTALGADAPIGDPMRPPAQWFAARKIASPTAAAAAAAATTPGQPGPAADTSAPAVPAAPSSGLQSIIARGENRVAMINGTRVKVGDRINDATVEAITDVSVVLRTASGAETLRLFNSNPGAASPSPAPRLTPEKPDAPRGPSR